MAIKSIRFKGVVKSSGIVNFDSRDAKWLLRKAKKDSVSQLSRDNVKLAKHAIRQTGVDENGNPILEAVLKISKDCLRQAIFREDQPNHNPGIVHAPKLLLNLLASSAGLLRGYMFADLGIKRKSSVYISDAIQISNNVSTIDIGTMNAPKESKVDPDTDESGLTLHYKETIGGIVDYEFEGAIDMSELQFLSTSEVYDRKAVDPNYLDEYIANLEKTLGSKVNDNGFYVKTTAVNSLPEEGLLLTSDQVKVLIKEFFLRLFDLEILRGASGRAWIDSLEVMPKESGLDTTNWIPVKTADDVIKLISSIECYYKEFDQKTAEALFAEIETGKHKATAVKAAKKTPRNKVQG